MDHCPHEIQYQYAKNFINQFKDEQTNDEQMNKSLKQSLYANATDSQRSILEKLSFDTLDSLDNVLPASTFIFSGDPLRLTHFQDSSLQVYETCFKLKKELLLLGYSKRCYVSNTFKI